jgi:hypothetical protein
MSNDELLNTANREFEQILPSFSMDFSNRIAKGFQVVNIAPAIRFVDPTNYTAPGDSPNQTGPSLPAQFFTLGGNGLGDTSFPLLNILGAPSANAVSGTANPGSVPPVGPEEKLRYSCVSGKCLQDPNGIYLGLDECLQNECGSFSGGGTGGSGSGCDCGYGPSQTVFKAEITTVSAPLTSPLASAGTYYQYGWTEVTTRANPRTSTVTGLAINEHEYSVANNGGNIPPTGSTLTRRSIPVGSRVPMYLDETGLPWFHMVNPLQVVCT